MDAVTRLKLIAVPDTEWIKEAQYQRDNDYWLQISFEIATAVLSALGKKDMTQRELAKLMGCSPQYVNKILKGSENLTLETICKLEKVLQIKLIETPYSHLREANSSSQPAQ
ncbi:helix-turn-helix transcriptional regulator [Dyadobacter sp. CY261]|uniref:helix-turn-helix domain-containing protein n=1 Tax=Dyadobacter sp. CY261 TaxID=2907203 RepID=UPI001F1C8703|nr:helix-turn-helix transcriptional regulator [Dyadobacter sp. CY261]MCF0069134.1 helix-turn-helix transcriptional regulator [Dyadobacter sp. CY261]